jgi:ABC-2 type transport system permease protein
MVNLCQTRSSTNALVLSGIYLSVCLVIPALASLALTIWHPLPSRTALLHTLRAARDRNESHQKAVLAEYWKSHPAERPAPGNTHPDDFQTAFFAAHDATDREIRPVAAAFMERQSERTRRAAALRYLSPAMLLQDALSDAAGTGEARYQTFLEQVEEFRSKWRAFFAPQVYRQTPVPPEEWRRVPRFTFREEPLNAVLARVGGSVLAIVIGTTALAALAACTFRSFRLDD